LIKGINGYACGAGSAFLSSPVATIALASNGCTMKKNTISATTHQKMVLNAPLVSINGVDAVDIYKPAVECAKYNARANRVSNKIRVFESDLFSNIPRNKYDLIIANLPIVDCQEEDIKLHSLIDPGFQYHKRLFEEASEYLTKDGRIVLCHADLQGEEDFDKLERLAEENGFSYKISNSIDSLGHEWRMYSFRRKNDESYRKF